MVKLLSCRTTKCAIYNRTCSMHLHQLYRPPPPAIFQAWIQDSVVQDQDQDFENWVSRRLETKTQVSSTPSLLFSGLHYRRSADKTKRVLSTPTTMFCRRAVKVCYTVLLRYVLSYMELPAKLSSIHYFSSCLWVSVSRGIISAS